MIVKQKYGGLGMLTRRMHQLGIETGKDLQIQSSEFLQKHFGKAGKLFAEFGKGEDHRLVESYRERLSVGCERTYNEDIFDKRIIYEKFENLANELEKRIEHSQFQGHTFTLKIKRDDFKLVTRSISTDNSLHHACEFINLAKELLESVNLGNHGIRLAGFSVSKPESKETQSSLLDPQLLIPFEPY